MSNIEKRNIKCAVCDKESEQIILLSHSNFAKETEINLDSRTKDDSNEFFDLQLQKCPHCHYVTEDISTLLCDTTKADVISSDYKEIVDNQNLDLLSLKYILYARLLFAAIKDDNATKEELAGVYTQLSWIFDDQNNTKKAIKARQNAINLYIDSLKDNQYIQSYIFISDFYRRNNEFDKAIEYAKLGLSKSDKYNFENKILSYEIYLSIHKDNGIHTIDGLN